MFGYFYAGPCGGKCSARPGITKLMRGRRYPEGLLVLVLFRPPTRTGGGSRPWPPSPRRERSSDLEEQRQRQREAGRAADAIADQQEAPSPEPLDDASLEGKGGP